MIKKNYELVKIDLDITGLKSPLGIQAAEFFIKTWEPAYQDIYGRDLITSDAFLVNDYALALLEDGKIIAQGLIKEVDLSVPILYRHNHLIHYPDHIIDELKNIGNRFLMVNHFSVSEPRDLVPGVKLSVGYMQLLFLHSLYSKTSGAFSFLRLTRGMDKVVDKAGYRALGRMIVEGTEVEAAYACPEKTVEKMKSYPEIVLEIFEKRSANEHQRDLRDRDKKAG